LLNIPQQEHRSIGGGELIDRAMDERAHFVSLDLGRRIIRAGDVMSIAGAPIGLLTDFLEGDFPSGRIRAQLHEAGIDGNAVQPGGEARMVVESTYGIERRDECLLHRVVAIVVAAQKSPSDDPHLRAKQCDQPGAGGLNAALNLADEIGLLFVGELGSTSGVCEASHLLCLQKRGDRAM
jgi:hypothetical protein